MTRDLERRVTQLERGTGTIYADAEFLALFNLPPGTRLNIGALLMAVDGKTRGIPTEGKDAA